MTEPKSRDQRIYEALRLILGVDETHNDPSFHVRIFAKYDTDPAFHNVVKTAAQLLIENEDLRARLCDA